MKSASSVFTSKVSCSPTDFGSHSFGEAARLGLEIFAPAAEPLGELSALELAKVAHGADATLVQLGLGLRPDARDDTDDHRIEERLDVLWPDDREAVGLLEVRRDLGDELVRAQAHGARESLALGDFALERLHALQRRLERAEGRKIEIRLVDTRLFEEVAAGRQDRHDPLGHLDVELAIAVDEGDRGLALLAGRLGQLPGARDGHG
jgi:hypothetical protein